MSLIVKMPWTTWLSIGLSNGSAERRGFIPRFTTLNFSKTMCKIKKIFFIFTTSFTVIVRKPIHTHRAIQWFGWSSRSVPTGPTWEIYIYQNNYVKKSVRTWKNGRSGYLQNLEIFMWCLCTCILHLYMNKLLISLR